MTHLSLLQAAPVESGKEVIEAVKNGKMDEFIDQIITMGTEAGKSILLAAVVAVIGYWLKPISLTAA